MADFCKQCSEELFLVDFGDMAGLIPSDETAISVLCEGCGPTLVNPQGECLFHERAGNTAAKCLISGAEAAAKRLNLAVPNGQ